jgi:hypothetical protein
MSTIYEFVKEPRDNYRSQTIEIADGYEFSQYQTLRTIELYHNSKFETGNKDSVVPSPAQPAPEPILKAYQEKPINLEALFTGGNPFEEAGGAQADDFANA